MIDVEEIIDNFIYCLLIVLGLPFALAAMAVMMVTFPIWIIPYLIWKKKKRNNEWKF